MAARQEVTLIVSARDRTRAVFRRIRGAVQRMRVGLGGLIAGGAFAALARQALDFATAMEGASARLDVSVETLQALKVIAEDLNVPFDTLQGVIQRLTRNAGAARRNTELAETFAELGVRFDELETLAPEELFFRMADAIQEADRAGNLRETLALLARVGDTEAVRLRGLLVQGGDALREGVAELKQSGGIQGADEIRAAAEAEAEARRALLEAQQAFTSALTELTPLLSAFITRVSPLIERYADAIERGGATGGFGLGEAAFRAFGEERNVSGTLEDPAVKAALQRTAAAAEQTAENTRNSGVLR